MTDRRRARSVWLLAAAAGVLAITLSSACNTKDATVPVRVIIPDPQDIAEGTAGDPFAGVQTLRLSVRAGTPGGTMNTLYQKLYPADTQSMSIHGLVGGHDRFVVLEGLAETIAELDGGAPATVISRGSSVPASYLARNQQAPSGKKYPAAYLFFARVGELTKLRATMVAPRAFFSAADLGNGRIALIGGVDPDGNPLDSVEYLDLHANYAFYAAKKRLSRPRAWSVAATLDRGGAIVAGGIDTANPADPPLTDAELLDEAANPGEVFDTSVNRMFFAASVADIGGQFFPLFIGGSATREILDPVYTAYFWNGGGIGDLSDTLRYARSAFTATALSDGRVLIAGGYSQHLVLEQPVNEVTATAEIFDGRDSSGGTSLFQKLSSQMSSGRWGASASVLRVGTGATAQEGVLIAGGAATLASDGAYAVATSSCDLFLRGLVESDPHFASSSGGLPVLSEARAFAQQATAASGDVLISGGMPIAGRLPTDGVDPLASTDVWVASQQKLAPGPVMGRVAALGRVGHVEIPLPDGTILIAGGMTKNGVVLRTAEVWVPPWP